MYSVKSLGPDLVFVKAAGTITMENVPSLDRRITAMAVREGKIQTIGSDASVLAIAGNAQIVDLEDTVVMPGLIDSHNHFLSTGLGWNRIQLDPVRSVDELLQTIAKRVRETPEGEWILGSPRWHETKLTEGRMPTADELDRVAPKNPVYLPRGGHIVVTNSLGLEQAGISQKSENPIGGEYGRDGSGKLNGMLVERPAFASFEKLLPEITETERRRAISEAITAYNRLGITSIREPGLGPTEIESFRAVVPNARALRTSIMRRVDQRGTAEQRRNSIDEWASETGSDNQWLTIWGLKMGIDGGVEGGYFRDPYANNPEFRGFPFLNQGDLEELIQQAHGVGWRIGLHVVGDAAMEMVLDAFQRIDRQTPIGSRGHVLEHAFSPIPGGIERTRDMGLSVTLQHALVFSLAGNMKTYWGQQRAMDCTPSREWLESGVVIGAGTDSPVTSYDPWLNVYGFATRDTETAGIMGPEHRISIADTLRCYTAGSATVLGMDHLIGSLVPGKAADFICLDRDPILASPEEVRDLRVLRTVVNGRQVFPA